jgi:hypothetical protein
MHSDDTSEPKSHSATQAAPGTSEAAEASKQWSDFERDLDLLGRQLAELGTHTSALGVHLVNSLDARYQEVKARAEDLKRATEQDLDAARRSAWQQAGQAQSSFDEARARSKETARQMWERAEPLRQGARDVGDGLIRAWTELRASLGKAASRLQETPSPKTSKDEHRETT